MNTNVVVSVIIPCYMQGQYLAESIGSLLLQTHPNWEAIIVDDGSPDDTGSIAARLAAEDRRVRVISQANLGRSAAKNAGMRAARGDLVQFLDADDLLPPRKLELHAGIISNSPADLDIVYSNAWYFPDGRPQERTRAGFGTDPHEDWIAACAAEGRSALEKLVYRNIMPICAPLMRRSVMESVGFFDEELNVLEDWEYWMRCASYGFRIRFEHFPDADVLIRLHAASISQDRRTMNAGVFAMRLATLKYVSDRKVRQLILADAGKNITGDPALPEDSSYERLSKVVNGLDERVALWIAKTCGPRGTRGAALDSVIGMLPWRLRLLADQ